MHNCIFLLNAGHETTTNLIGNGLVTLSVWTDERDALLREPALIESAVEECLRFESSNQLGNRMTMLDTESKAQRRLNPETINATRLEWTTSVGRRLSAAARENRYTRSHGIGPGVGR